MIGEELPVVSSLYDITQTGFYRCGNEIVEQCTASIPGCGREEVPGWGDCDCYNHSQ